MHSAWGTLITQGNPIQAYFPGYGENTQRQFLTRSGTSQVPILAPLLGYSAKTKKCLQTPQFIVVQQLQDEIFFSNYYKLYILKAGATTSLTTYY
jgi:hypothetical protein